MLYFRNKSWRITLPLRIFIQKAKALSKWQKNIKSTIKTKIKLIIFHLYLFSNQHPKFRRAADFALARFPNIRTRLKEIINERILSPLDFFVNSDPLNLSPRVLIIYDDLQAKIEGRQRRKN